MVNSKYWKRRYLKNIGRGGEGGGKWVNVVNSVYWLEGKVNG